MSGLELALAALTAVATFGGTAATVIYARSSAAQSRAKAEAEVLRNRLHAAVKEIEACHAEEDLFCQELESIGAGSANSIKIEFRNRVETLGLNRPSWKPSRIKEELARLEGGTLHAVGDIPERPMAPARPARSGPIQTVIAHHLDRALNGGENSGILPMQPPVIADAPAPAAPKPVTASRPRTGPDVEV